MPVYFYLSEEPDPWQWEERPKDDDACAYAWVPDCEPDAGRFTYEGRPICSRCLKIIVEKAATK